MAKQKNPDVLTDEQQAARDQGVEEETQQESAPKKSELQRNVIHEGTIYRRGTKVSDLPDGVDKERLERVGAIKS